MLDGLTARRRAHSLAVGRCAESAVVELPERWRPVVVQAAFLHDVGYAEQWAATGFHPLDGAHALRRQGFDHLVCHLVALHTGATFEAVARGIDLEEFSTFAYHGPAPASMCRSIVTWADLTTGPDGSQVSAQQRADEILARYEPGQPVHTWVTRSYDWILSAGASPLATADTDPIEDARRLAESVAGAL